MSFAKDDLIAVLRLRYDYYSASNVFDTARERASVADKAAYEAADVRAIRAVLPQVGDRLTAVLERFDELLGGAPAAKDGGGGGKKDDKKAEAPKAEVKAEKSDKTEKKAEAKAPAEEKKADDKKADADDAPKGEVKAEKSDKAEAADKSDDDKADAAS